MVVGPAAPPSLSPAAGASAVGATGPSSSSAGWTTAAVSARPLRVMTTLNRPLVSSSTWIRHGTGATTTCHKDHNTFSTALVGSVEMMFDVSAVTSAPRGTSSPRGSSPPMVSNRATRWPTVASLSALAVSLTAMDRRRRVAISVATSTTPSPASTEPITRRSTRSEAWVTAPMTGTATASDPSARVHQAPGRKTASMIEAATTATAAKTSTGISMAPWRPVGRLAAIDNAAASTVTPDTRASQPCPRLLTRGQRRGRGTTSRAITINASPTSATGSASVCKGSTTAVTALCHARCTVARRPSSTGGGLSRLH
ncbi:hypothetical protein [Ornithinimicrobium kibberense]|uniref:hypothetical protein n=1 Tax=Ornithinimicrobium kibberense TaxID=282060 RepID=UPI0036135B0A